MKRPRISAVIVLFFITIGIAAFGVYIFLEIRKPPEAGVRETVKHFSLASLRSLDEWKEKILTRNRTDYSVAEHGGRDCVKAVSENSASAFFYRQRLSCDMDPFISWDWKAAKFPSLEHKESLSKKDEFDFAAQVYVIFSARFILNAKAIQYVWTRDIPSGTVAASPYTEKVRIMVLQSGESEEWKHEKRNIRDDFRSLFGKKLEKDVAVISFMTDSDSTGSSAEAYYSDITVGYLELERKEELSDI